MKKKLSLWFDHIADVNGQKVDGWDWYVEKGMGRVVGDAISFFTVNLPYRISRWLA